MKEFATIGNSVYPDYVLSGWEKGRETEKAIEFVRTRGPIRPVWIPKKAVEGWYTGADGKGKPGFKIAYWYAEKNEMKGLKYYPVERKPIV
jgi:hypothetical protein